eukprot:snap_masked-scaffold_15-processed-gene-9.35-mRNA-1 protein AED:1.00 eAED:1.00 QI:0/0/0/0/1/1/2/0/59
MKSYTKSAQSFFCRIFEEYLKAVLDIIQENNLGELGNSMVLNQNNTQRMWLLLPSSKEI